MESDQLTMFSLRSERRKEEMEMMVEVDASGGPSRGKKVMATILGQCRNRQIG